MNERNKAALTLAHEVIGAFGIAELALRQALGNTNAGCLLRAAENVLAFEEPAADPHETPKEGK